MFFFLVTYRKKILLILFTNHVHGVTGEFG